MSAVPPVVVKRCSLCERAAGSWTGLPHVTSPQGVEHVPSDYGVTLCGHDATKPKWWWSA